MVHAKIVLYQILIVPYAQNQIYPNVKYAESVIIYPEILVHVILKYSYNYYYK